MLTKQDELKDRVEATRHLLQARLAELKADTRHDAIAAKDKINSALEELDKTLGDGWDKATEAVTSKLSAWLTRNDAAPKG
jgi:hypothetical protein